MADKNLGWSSRELYDLEACRCSKGMVIEADGTETLARMGAKISRQDKVQLGKATPVDTAVTTTDISTDVDRPAFADQGGKREQGGPSESALFRQRLRAGKVLSATLRARRVQFGAYKKMD